MQLRAVILDWAGTTVDFGCQGPVAVLLEIFDERGVPITAAEARDSMGLLKKDQIRAICGLDSVRQRWRAKFGGEPGESDVEELFAAFIPRQISVLDQHAEVIPGVVEAVDRMRRRGLRIGTTTGYTRPMLEVLLQRAAAQGYRPDSAVCPDDVGGGRPMPWRCYRNAIDLKVYPLSACVKIGDTVSDVQEGLNAGMWTVGVAATGNETGWTLSEYRQTGEAERSARIAEARARLERAGAHYVADSVGECDAILDAIEERAAAGHSI